MKKFLLMIAVLLFANPVMAKNIKVEALSDFSTENPPSTWEIKIVEGFEMEDGRFIAPNTILKGDIVETTNPKKLKRNATFKFVPKYFSQGDYIQQVRRDFVGKYSSISELTPKNVAKKGAVTAGNILVGSFVAPTVGLVEGAVKNEKGNRAKSAIVSAYESTPLSYASKGKELEFKKGQVFVMSFKLKEKETDEDMPNYTYSVVE